MLKKNLVMLIIFILLISLCSSVHAIELKTKLSIIQQASETKELENNQGTISKKIVSLDEEKGEVTIHLDLKNVKPNTSSEDEIYDNTEIFIIIPESANAFENEKITYIETLADKILKKNSKTKIGIIGIQGPIFDGYIDEEGKLVYNENDERNVKGTENNAECIVELTDNIDTLKTKLSNMNSDKKYYNNVQAALRLARKSFSNNVNKILISLYDDVPSTAIGVKSSTDSYGGSSKYATAEEAVKAHLQELISNTKSEILSLKTYNIDFILLRPDDTKFDQKWYDQDRKS